jgi:hypothetical protein
VGRGNVALSLREIGQRKCGCVSEILGRGSVAVSVRERVGRGSVALSLRERVGRGSVAVSVIICVDKSWVQKAVLPDFTPLPLPVPSH